MASVTLELRPEMLSALRLDPVAFVAEMRVAAAAKWYELGRLSQAKAAEVAGLSRVEFLAALDNYGVTAFQSDAEELIAEVERG
ncbi:MAG: UPF0175 family protein [Armatimonadetes bacterium]|nr:UPF0175 family protein [Armatimonadota bacterium]